MSNAQSNPTAEGRKTKLDQILKALGGRHGATLPELTTLTGWQPHTVRAALTRLRQRGHVIERNPTKSGGTRYRVKKAGSPVLRSGDQSRWA